MNQSAVEKGMQKVLLELGNKVALIKQDQYGEVWKVKNDMI